MEIVMLNALLRVDCLMVSEAKGVTIKVFSTTESGTCVVVI